MWAAPEPAMPVKEATGSGWVTASGLSGPHAIAVCGQFGFEQSIRRCIPGRCIPVGWASPPPLPSQFNLSDLVEQQLQLISCTQCGSTPSWHEGGWRGGLARESQWGGVHPPPFPLLLHLPSQL